MFDTIIEGYRTVLHFMAEMTVDTLELIGIIIILAGTARAIFLLLPLLYLYPSEGLSPIVLLSTCPIRQGYALFPSALPHLLYGAHLRCR